MHLVDTIETTLGAAIQVQTCLRIDSDVKGQIYRFFYDTFEPGPRWRPGVTVCVPALPGTPSHGVERWISMRHT